MIVVVCTVFFTNTMYNIATPCHITGSQNIQERQSQTVFYAG